MIHRNTGAPSVKSALVLFALTLEDASKKALLRWLC